MRKEPQKQLCERLYRKLYCIRRTEEKIAEIYPTDKIKSPVHLSIGQESVSVGVCDVLRPDDVVFGTYRSHALYLAKGGNLERMMAELFGKKDGCTRGKGGSMHLVDVGAGMMGCSAIVGTTIPQAVGYAYALKVRKSDRIVAVFFGDGAADEGVFSESLNFASLKRLPILFVCENNLYAALSPIRDRLAGGDLCLRAESYGIPTTRIEDGDVLAIREEAAKAVAAIRAEKGGPRFFECMTYRWREHVGPGEDWHLGYRDRAEGETWIAKDQVSRIGGQLERDDRERICAAVATEISEAFEFAEKSPFPDAEELGGYVFQ